MDDLGEFAKMEKIGHRYVIQYFHLKGLSPTNIKAELDSTLEESAPSFTTVKYWVAEFKRGRTSCEDEHRSGRPSEVAIPEMVKKIHKMVLGDRRLKVRELADMVNISKSAVHRILAENLEMRKLCARWVPRLLTIEQKQRREDVELKFELLLHAPYSPDLAPLDYFLFPNLKKWLGGRRFTNNEEVESAVNGYFEEFNGSYYKQAIEAIEHRWEKCIELKGDYVC